MLGWRHEREDDPARLALVAAPALRYGGGYVGVPARDEHLPP
jgi:hypothetical protein